MTPSPAKATCSSHSATLAAETGYRVRYTLASKRVNELAEAANDKQLTKLVNHYGFTHPVVAGVEKDGHPGQACGRSLRGVERGSEPAEAQYYRRAPAYLTRCPRARCPAARKRAAA